MDKSIFGCHKIGMVVGIKENADSGGRTVLESTEVSLITNGPALIGSIIAVIALIA
jgi:hypothetical protein